MLTNIENRLEELFEMIETMPQDKVEAAEKVSTCTCLYVVKDFFFFVVLPVFKRAVRMIVFGPITSIGNKLSRNPLIHVVGTQKKKMIC